MNLPKAFSAWAEKLNDVDSESSHRIKRIRLASVEGQTWHTWDTPIEDVKEFVDDVGTVLDALAEEWPARVVQVTITAEDAQSTVVATIPISVRGRNKSASGALMNSEPRAMADAMDSLARTTERLLGMSNTQIKLADERAALLAKENAELRELIISKEELRLVEAQTAENTTNELTQQFMGVLPMLLEFFQKGAPGLPPAFKTAVHAVAAHAANGSSSEQPQPTPGE